MHLPILLLFLALHMACAETSSDSIAAPVRAMLDPPTSSWMEHALWGSSGAMRAMGIAGPLTVAERRSELSLRRTMLTTHQIGGFVSLGLMLGATYCGQRTLDGDVSYRRTHSEFVLGTIIAYSATAMLAVLSPPPLLRRDETSTTTIHKTLAWVHAAGMILTPILGGLISRRAGSTTTAHFHQVAAYVTTAAMAASMVVMTF